MKYFLDTLKNKYAQFSGRSRRAEYWQFFLFNIIFSLVLGFVGRLIHFPFIGVIYSLALLVPGIAVSVRRMHDVDKDWWYLLIPIYSLILVCTEGTSGPNQYGPDPKNATVPAMDTLGNPPATY
ncbi:DUF805 domain-containing protein [Hymenobacter psoromatis]|uniref:DUF805 domain-containing protein n=1 Tax=Hymenobacter psoromatis TaxID=1484116 RepID=UPI001CC095DD|nr:DUF805 domain-containing protein [Hymenobacter psoromatis]